MDGLVGIHSEFLEKVSKLCLLDAKSRALSQAVQDVLQIGLDFRMLCKRFILQAATIHNLDSEEEDE
eukprot:CAMPEP_0170555344 /NCGR_PEP_ID=MMETSP0211-20121228/13252_1 /TAXON_ID=311385 /ORGANISM="Pseudokeronopsis sp., Strain OXSARD2" /LENGTH=66 /DNA_ID=CAMNT_0010865129 /DNA_START=150 /DNA_END=350 /DNA_ORIENTATION=-